MSDYLLFIFLFPDFQNPTVANFATIQKGRELTDKIF